jgi:hypothetical protein
MNCYGRLAIVRNELEVYLKKTLPRTRFAYCLPPCSWVRHEPEPFLRESSRHVA